MNNNLSKDEPKQDVEIKSDSTDNSNNANSTDQTSKQQGESMSGYVKQECVSQLLDMGFSKTVAEKACFFTQSDVERAVLWISEHDKDPDFEEELRVVGKE